MRGRKYNTYFILSYSNPYVPCLPGTYLICLRDLIFKVGFVSVPYRLLFTFGRYLGGQ